MSLIKKEWLTGRIAYLVYIFIAIIIIMLVKYKLEILKDERHYELKQDYDNESRRFHPM